MDYVYLIYSNEFQRKILTLTSLFFDKIRYHNMENVVFIFVMICKKNILSPI